jgi:(p)ppGpp synthase/HD superfamily hydrolase
MKFELCTYSEKLLNKIQKLEKQKDKSPEKLLWGDITKQSDNANPEAIDMVLVKKAIAYARHYHGEQKRKSGEPYYSHPIAVAFLVADYACDTESMVISLLHDTLEDTSLTVEEIEQEFGKAVADAVIDLTRMKSDIKTGTKVSAAQTVRKLWHQRKNNIMLIKLFDRLHNVLTIGSHRPEKQVKIIVETVAEFLPVAMYLKNKDLEARILHSCLTAVNDLTPGLDSDSAPKTLLDKAENQRLLSSEGNFRMPSPASRNG